MSSEEPRTSAEDQDDEPPPPLVGTGETLIKTCSPQIGCVSEPARGKGLSDPSFHVDSIAEIMFSQ
jgi:hypothetical protein